MKVKHLDHLNLTVRDFAETVDWYRRVFGFEVVQEATDDGVRWGVIRSGEAMLCIYEHPEFEFEDGYTRRDRGQHSVKHFALRITDRKEWEETASRQRLEFGYGGGAVRWPHSTAWYVRDPTGYEIEVALWDDDTVRF
ncbi:MAG: VOC family protein [Planctomycetota bacterium]|jgi:catechol 2,3-dioxygenase-like lactoylglutathione lyase family enzyme